MAALKALTRWLTQNVTTVELGYLSKVERTGCAFIGYVGIVEGFDAVTVTFVAPVGLSI